MKNSFLIFLLLLLTKVSFAQDTTKIVYSQEVDTLVKQRFIDKYENVFMTKVQTRHMFKIGISQYYQARSYPLIDDKIFNNTSLHLGYEFKILPAFSIAISGHFPYADFGNRIKSSLEYTVIDAQLRWFVDMRKRIKSGKSANNFSGNYIAVYYNMPGTFDNNPRIGLKVGFQRRFLNSGFMDFAFAVEQQGFAYGSLSEWSFSSQSSFGFAFGDWKKSTKAPLCDILLCDVQLREQWKIRLPEVTFGYYLNRVRLGVAYERKLSNSPVSVNFQFDLAINRGFDDLKRPEYIYGYGYTNYSNVYSHEFAPSLSVEPRYYFTQQKQKLIGKGNNPFSGLYTGLHSEYSYYRGSHSFTNPMEPNLVVRKHIFKVGPLFGFQQRLFNHGYLDIGTSLYYQNQSLTSNRKLAVGAKLGIGFAF